jgi:hypothetical protein
MDPHGKHRSRAGSDHTVTDQQREESFVARTDLTGCKETRRKDKAAAHKEIADRQKDNGGSHDDEFED